MSLRPDGYPHWMGDDAVSNRRWAITGALWAAALVASSISLALAQGSGGLALCMLFVSMATVGTFVVLLQVVGGTLGQIRFLPMGVEIGPRGPTLDPFAPTECEWHVSRVVFRSMRAQSYGPAVRTGLPDSFAWAALRVRQGSLDVTFRTTRVPTTVPFTGQAHVCDRMRPGSFVVHTSQEALESIARVFGRARWV